MHPGLRKTQGKVTGYRLRLVRAAAREWHRATGRPGDVVGTLGEYEVAARLGGFLAPLNASGHDVILADGTRVQVKTRTQDRQGRNSVLRGVQRQDWDLLVLVFLDPDTLEVLSMTRLDRSEFNRVRRQTTEGMRASGTMNSTTMLRYGTPL